MDRKIQLERDIAIVEALLTAGGHSPDVKATLTAVKQQMERQLSNLQDEARSSGKAA
jgi:hypothetical protein